MSLTGMLLLQHHFRVPRSDDFPSQKVIDTFTLPLCISARTPYRSSDERVLAIRYFQEIQRRLKEKQSEDHVFALRFRILYEIEKRWHEEQYVMISAAAATHTHVQRGTGVLSSDLLTFTAPSHQRTRCSLGWDPHASNAS